MTTPRRRRLWSDVFIDESTESGGFDEDLLINPADDADKGMTLVRMIIDLTLTPGVFVSGSVDAMIVSLGVGLTSDEVVAGSILVSLEGEVPMSGWLWRWREILLESPSTPGVLRIYDDIRSQRKLMYGEPRLFLGTLTSHGTPFTVLTQGLVRSLYLLP